MRLFVKKIIGEIFFTLAILGALGFGLWYVAGDMLSTNLNINKIKKDFYDKTTSLSQLVVFKQSAIMARADLASLRNFFPNRDGLLSFNEEVKRIASSSDVSASFSFGNEVAGKEGLTDAILFFTTISGNYQNIINFMADLESSSYFTKINTFDIISQGSNTNSYQAVISGEVYFK